MLVRQDGTALTLFTEIEHSCFLKEGTEKLVCVCTQVKTDCKTNLNNMIYLNLYNFKQ